MIESRASNRAAEDGRFLFLLGRAKKLGEFIGPSCVRRVITFAYATGHGYRGEQDLRRVFKRELGISAAEYRRHCANIPPI